MKTLKDIEDKLLDEGKGQSFLVGFGLLRHLAIKWIKEEIRIWESRHSLSKKGKTTDVPIIKRWMERFDITEEDLK